MCQKNPLVSHLPMLQPRLRGVMPVAARREKNLCGCKAPAPARGGGTPAAQLLCRFSCFIGSQTNGLNRVTRLWFSNHTKKVVFPQGSRVFFSPAPYTPQGSVSKVRPCGACAASHSVPALPRASCQELLPPPVRWGTRQSPLFTVLILPVPSHHTGLSNLFFFF